MGQLVLEDESFIHYLLDHTEFPGVMQKKITLLKFFKDRCKYLSFILHLPCNGLTSSKIADIILFATSKPFVILYVKFVASGQF
jgi:hypothetical protein